MTHAQWTEKYRPKTWADVVGQDQTVTTLRTMATKGALGGRALWLSGKSGNGKTTIARLVALEVADPDFITELDAGALTGASIRDIEQEWAYHGWGKGGKAVIINEAHHLQKPATKQLLLTLERIPQHVTMVFTTTLEGEAIFDDLIDSSAFLSRCMTFSLAQRGVSSAYVERCKAILAAEGLPETLIPTKLAQDNANNLRAMIQQIEQLSYCVA